MLMKQCENKKHLIVLKLIRFLKYDHNNVLYIGNDKNVIELLKKHNFCHTFYVKTKGITERDLNKIYEKYFKGWIQNDT